MQQGWKEEDLIEDLVSHLCSVASCGLTHALFPFPEDTGLRAGPLHAPVASSSLPQSCLQRGFGKAVEPVWAVRARPAQPGSPPLSGLVTDYFGQQVEEAGAAGDWARAFAGCFQEAAPAFHLGKECWSRAQERRQPGVGLREQRVRGVGPCAHPTGLCAPVLRGSAAWRIRDGNRGSSAGNMRTVVLCRDGTWLAAATDPGRQGGRTRAAEEQTVAGTVPGDRRTSPWTNRAGMEVFGRDRCSTWTAGEQTMFGKAEDRIQRTETTGCMKGRVFNTETAVLR